MRGIPDSENPSERKGLVEHVYEMAVHQRVDAVLIEQKTRGTDLYNELERLTQEWPFGLEYFSPVKSKEIRLETCVPLFTNEHVWAPDKKWADTVISEVARITRPPRSGLSPCPNERDPSRTEGHKDTVLVLRIGRQGVDLIPAEPRHTVPDGTTMSAGQSSFTPSQNSATSQSPAAPRQRSVLFWSAGQSALVPSQTSAMSH